MTGFDPKSIKDPTKEQPPQQKTIVDNPAEGVNETEEEKYIRETEQAYHDLIDENADEEFEIEW